ncbi:MAG: hypothetical protein AB1540_03660 [Bdellovibrionota bacterium]
MNLSQNSIHLKRQIEQWAEYWYTTGPMFIKARQGALTVEELGRYLKGLEYLFSRAVSHMNSASESAKKSGNPELASFFKEKLKEELGHDLWATGDLARLEKEANQKIAPQVCSSIYVLDRFIENSIHSDPIFYLGYSLLAEYITVLLAPRWIRDLEEKCQISRACLTAVSNHEEADRDHVEDNLNQFDRLAATQKDLNFESMLSALGRIVQLYVEFSREVVSEVRDARESGITQPTIST